MDVAGSTAEAIAVQPSSSLHCFLLIVRDVDEGRDQGTPLFFSMAESYWQRAARPFELFGERVQEILDGFFDRHEDELFSRPWAELTLLPAGSSLPLVISTEVELQDLIEGHYRNSCCAGLLS